MPVRMSGEDLTRILVNLVKNAVEAMPAGGRIQLSLRESPTEPGADPWLTLNVEDNGPGIACRRAGKHLRSPATRRGQRRTQPNRRAGGRANIAAWASPSRGPSWRRRGDGFTQPTATLRAPASRLNCLFGPREAALRAHTEISRDTASFTEGSTRRIQCSKQSLHSGAMEFIPQFAEPAAKLHLLVVDADPAVRSACAEIAASLGYAVESTATWTRLAVCCAATRPTFCW